MCIRDSFRTGRFESSQKFLHELKEKLPGPSHPLYSVTIRKLVRTYSNLNQNETALELISGLIVDYENRENYSWDIKHMRHHMVKGMILNKLGRVSEAILHTEIAKLEAEKVNNKIILNNCKSELARYNLSLGNLEVAKKQAHEAHEHYEVLKLNYPSMTSTRVTLGRIYLTEKAYAKAKKYFEEAIVLAKRHYRLFDHRNALKGLLECSLGLGEDEQKTLHLFREYDTLKDSLLNENVNLAVQDLKIKYESEKKADAIIQLNMEKKIARENLKSAQRNNLYLLAAILFLLLSGVLLSYLYRNKLKAQKLLEQKNLVIADSLDEKKLLLKEIHHRVKNNLQTVSSLLSLQSNYIQDEKVVIALKEGQNRVQSMALIHQNLYQEDDLRKISLPSYFKRLVFGLYKSYEIGLDRITLSMDIEDVKMDVETVIPIGLITNELVTNVFKYAFDINENGQLKVSLKGINPTVLTISDNGKGIPQNLVASQEESFGYQMIQAFCNKLGAQLNIESDNGTTVTISISNKVNTSKNEKNINSRR